MRYLKHYILTKHSIMNKCYMTNNMTVSTF